MPILHPVRRPALRAARLTCQAAGLGAFSLLAACQSMPAQRTGYLSSYEGMAEAKPAKRRDEAASGAIRRVYIEPTVLRLNARTPIKPSDQVLVRQEIDRQLCYKLSRRFEIAPRPDADTARVRAAVAHIAPTNRSGSAATAAVSYFIPVPIVKFRAPGISGGLVAEAELVTPDGRQAAAIAWSKSTEGISNMDPSLSPVGDALQLSEKFADAAGKAFAAKASKKHAVPKPDPCARFGARIGGRALGGMLVGFGTGLYAPSVTGAGRPPEVDAEAPKP